MESGFALLPCFRSKIFYINAGILRQQGLVSPLLQLVIALLFVEVISA